MDYIYGTFLREQKTRFLCDVLIEDQEVECYVPASCKLSKLVDLTGKEVLLQPVNKPGARTAYAVYAAKLGRSYVLLNLAAANRVVEEQLYRRYFSFLGKRKTVRREAVIEGYKSDLYIEDTNTVIEIKTLLSFKKEGCFPLMNSERAVRQLEKLSEMLDAGYRIAYLIMSLNPAVKKIYINEDKDEYCRLFKGCIDKGMECKGFSVRLRDAQPEIFGTVEVIKNGG